MHGITTTVYHVIDGFDEIVDTFESYSEALDFVGDDEGLKIEREIIEEEPWGAD